MKAWAIFTTLAVALLWLVSLTRRDSEDGQPAPPVVQNAEPPKPFNPDEDFDKINLADLLSRPREELAARCLEKEHQIVSKEQLRTEGKLKFILSVSRYPISYPIWRQARYSAKRGMVLPPYLGEDAFDSNLALHLARFGDVEGAHKIADPSDTATAAEIDRLAFSRNYPAEWTRLVALYLHEAHYSLAEGNNDGARRLVAFHRQLNALLSDDARRGALGNALLSRGKLLLDQAMLTWTNTERSTTDMYLELIDQGLADWGTIPGPTLPPVRSAEQLAAWVGGKTQGRLVSGGDPQRALDMLELALPDQALQGVVGMFRPEGSLQEILVVYRPELTDIHEPRHISYWVEEQLATTSKSAANYRVETWLTKPSKNVGPLVRIIPRPESESSEPSAGPESARLPRDFGIINLDRTFEQNRRLFAWNQAGTRLTINDAKVLAKMKPPFAGQSITQAALVRDGKNDLVGDLQLKLAFDPAHPINLIELASPIWQCAGAADINVTGDRRDDNVELTWRNAETQLCLRVPNLDDQPPMLDVRQISEKDAAKRLESARLLDAAERKQRWSELKTMTRLDRKRDQFELGMSRAELAKSMARMQALRHEIPGGDLYTITSVRDDDLADWALRQAVARFDSTGRLIEARLRYCDLPNRKPGSANGGVLKLVDLIRTTSGAPEVVDQESTPGTDPKSPAKVWRWVDDTTLLQTQSDKGGVELLMKDCPLEHPQGRPLPPLYWLPRGPARCLLGTTREALFKQWNIKTPIVVDGAIYLRPDEASPFDAVLVWLDGDRVSRIVARHKRGGEALTNAPAAGRAVTEAWGRQAQVLGWPWQQQNAQGYVLNWGTYDDCTQVRIYFQESDNILRLFTEWK